MKSRATATVATKSLWSNYFVITTNCYQSRILSQIYRLLDKKAKISPSNSQRSATWHQQNKINPCGLADSVTRWFQFLSPSDSHIALFNLRAGPSQDRRTVHSMEIIGNIVFIVAVLASVNGFRGVSRSHSDRHLSLYSYNSNPSAQRLVCLLYLLLK